MTVRVSLQPAPPAPPTHARGGGRNWRPALLLSTAMLLGAALPAVAEPPPVNQAEAQSVEAGLRAWLTTQIGAVADIAALQLRVVAGDDSYRLELPLSGTLLDGAVTMTGGGATARLKPLGDTRWAIEDFRLPSPWTLEVDPTRVKSGKEALSGLTMKIGEQNAHGVLDTSFATPSSFDVRYSDYTTVANGKDGPQTTHIGNIIGHAAWQPTGDGLLTITSQSGAERYSIQSLLPDGTPLQVGIARAHTSVTATGVNADDLGALVQAAAALAASVRDHAAADNAGGMAEKPPGVPDADKPAVRTLVRSLAGMLGSLTSQTSYDGIQVSVGDKGGSLHRLSIGFDMAAPGGKADFAWRIALDGLESPLIPDGPIRDMMPHHVALTPHIGGIPKQDVIDLVLRSIDDPAAAGDMMTTAGDLLAKGPLRLGINDIAFDLGPAKLSGGGTVEVAALNEITGTAEFRATGLDALIRRSNTTKELKQAAPVLIFLKGIGRQEGETTVWKIRYAEHKLLVNDTDMTGMMQGK